MPQGYCLWSVGMVVEMVQGCLPNSEDGQGKVADL